MLLLLSLQAVLSYHVFIKHYKSDFYVCDTPHHDIHTDIPEPCGCDTATVYNVIPLNSFDVMILDAHTGKAFNLTCGDKLNLFLYTGYENQIFSLKTVADNVFAISHKGKCIEPNPHGNGYDYAPCDGSDNQLFRFIHIDHSAPAPHAYTHYIEPHRHFYSDPHTDNIHHTLGHAIHTPTCRGNRCIEDLIINHSCSSCINGDCSTCPRNDIYYNDYPHHDYPHHDTCGDNSNSCPHKQKGSCGTQYPSGTRDHYGCPY
ncbi:hypothetical protein NGRA_1331 [Nosema granulosis]|uniref:Uncharacterized protein n=1 Tax=Nosema granulosis TaxID=83296 RepID=A0A9P6KZ76_9MICR|nr:hypothetical protein NGRA_1331 [Nosema granulosis]